MSDDVFTPTAFALRLRGWPVTRGRALVIRFRGQGAWLLTLLVDEP